MTKPKLKITYRPRTDITGYENNARLHTDEQISEIAASIGRFGFTQPILIDENSVIIAGHGRLAAAEALELDEVPTITIEGLSELERRAYMLADNKIALNAKWDERLLAVELEALRLSKFDLQLTGFTELEVATRLDPPVDHRDEWEDMPEFNNEDAMAYRKLIVNFVDEDALKTFLEITGIEITDATKFVWYPAVEEDVTTDTRLVANE